MTGQSLRKAAILVAALDHRSADALLDQMPEAQAALVRQAVMELDHVQTHEQQAVIRQFIHPDTTRDAAVETGEAVELHLSHQAGEGLAPPTHDASVAKPAEAPRRGSLRHFQQAEIGQLVTLLSREHPQTIAVVAAQLPPARASQLLLHLPAQTQPDVLRRIGTLGETDPQIVREVQEAIAGRLSRQAPQCPVTGSGMATLKAILEGTDPVHRAPLVEALARLDPPLARQLQQDVGPGPEESRPEPANGPAQPGWDVAADLLDLHSAPAPARRGAAGPAAEKQPLVDQRFGDGSAEDQRRALRLEFADLDGLNNASLAAIFARADPEITLVALAGAGTELVDRIASQLPPRQARQLHRRMCRLGPIRLRDVEQAQRQLARLASQLCRQGTIQPPVKLRNWAAAA